MGSTKSSSWVEIEERGSVRLLLNEDNGRTAQLHTLVISNNERLLASHFLQKRKMAATQYLVQVIESRTSQSALCSEFISVAVITEQVKRASQLYPLSHSEVVDLLLGAMKGLQQIKTQFGFKGFAVNESMIGLNSKSQPRIWFDQNFAAIIPEKNQFLSSKSEIVTVERVFDVVQLAHENRSYPPRFQSLKLDLLESKNSTQSVVLELARYRQTLRQPNQDSRSTITRPYQELREESFRLELRPLLQNQIAQQTKPIQQYPMRLIKIKNAKTIHVYPLAEPSPLSQPTSFTNFLPGNTTTFSPFPAPRPSPGPASQPARTPQPVIQPVIVEPRQLKVEPRQHPFTDRLANPGYQQRSMQEQEFSTQIKLESETMFRKRKGAQIENARGKVQQLKKQVFTFGGSPKKNEDEQILKSLKKLMEPNLKESHAPHSFAKLLRSPGYHSRVSRLSVLDEDKENDALQKGMLTSSIKEFQKENLVYSYPREESAGEDFSHSVSNIERNESEERESIQPFVIEGRMGDLVESIKLQSGRPFGSGSLVFLEEMEDILSQVREASDESKDSVEQTYNQQWQQ